MNKVARRALQGAGILAGIGAIGAAGLGVHTARTWDRVWDAPLPAVTISTDPEVIRRGEYLVYGPAHCVECHTASWADFAKAASGETVALRGGNKFAVGPLGALYSPNLTPDAETGIGRWSDAELARMLRYSVRPNGRSSIDPMMPFGGLADEDVTAILSYLRSRPAVRNAVPVNEWTVMGKVVKSLTPTFKPRDPASVKPPATAPAEAPTRERGEYLARSVANCLGCHTPRDMMTFAAIGPDFSGGMEMESVPLPDADTAVFFRSPNLTPHPSSALSKFPDRETFVARFRLGGRQHTGSPMPWEAFQRMSDADLGALYEFFRSLPPSEGPTGAPDFRKES